MLVSLQSPLKSVIAVDFQITVLGLISVRNGQEGGTNKHTGKIHLIPIYLLVQTLLFYHVAYDQ